MTDFNEKLDYFCRQDVFSLRRSKRQISILNLKDEVTSEISLRTLTEPFKEPLLPAQASKTSQA